ncbi:MAG: glycosyltransferase family 4 protein [Opitutaceae bacterium]|nr:glycosyltransferase family 4 protein [Opitutaceae bacterium]
MNILIRSSVFYPSIGGLENLTVLLATEFVKSGHAVKVITEQPQDPLNPLPDIEVLPAGNAIAELKLFLWSDIFYMPNITLKGVWVMAFNPWKKWIISHNDFHLTHSQNWKNKLKKNLIARASKNISVSQSVAESLDTPSDVVHNCYDNEIFKIYPEETRRFDFLFVGRLVTQKGCDLLIEACTGLPAPFTLNIVGDGSERQNLHDKVAARGLSDRVRFLGEIEKEPLARLMNQHRVMIVPSLRAEGFGIVALEGLACGCKMLVSNAGGLPEAIAGFSEVFPMGDVDALRACMRTQCAPSEPTDLMPPVKLQFLKDHSKQYVARKYLDLFA